MNICIITAGFLPETLGSSFQLYNMCGHFSNMGHQVLLLCPDYSLEEEIYPAYRDYLGEIFPNVIVKPVPSQKNMLRPDKIKFQESGLWNLEAVIGEFIPEVIHVDDPDRIYGLALYGMDKTFAYRDRIAVEYAGRHGIPAAAYYQTNYPEFSRQVKPEHVVSPYMRDKNRVYQEVYKGYDKVLCSGRNAGEHLLLHGIDNVICGKFLGVNEAVFDSNSGNADIKESESVKILYAGRFDGGKDIRIVLELFREAASQNERVELYLAGTGSPGTVDFVKAACEKDRRIKYLGLLSQNELVEVYNSVDIYFSPHASDTFGLSVIEAMYRGLPVIVSNRGGPVDFVRHRGNGYVCETPGEYVLALNALCSDKALRRAFGRQSGILAQVYKGELCAQRLIHTYNELLKKVG